MANHPSAEKRHRQNKKRNVRNRSARSALRTAVKATLQCVEAGDSDGARNQARLATKLLDKAAVHGIIHKRNAQRTISRLSKRVEAKNS